MKKITTFGFEENFIARLADFLEENYLKKGRDLSRLAIVFGGKRPALFLKRELAKRVKNSFFPPKFFAIDEFIDYALLKKEHFTKAADLDLCYQVYHLARKNAPAILRGRKTFAQFLPWAREILGFIEQLDLEDVDAESLRNIEMNARIGYSIPKDINILLEHIIALREACHLELAESKTYTRGLRYLAAARVIEDLDFKEFDQVLFCGFFHLHKTEKEIIQSLYRRDKAILFFQGDEDRWPVLKRTARDFKHSLAEENMSAVPSFDLKLYSGFDTHSQVGLVREIVKKLSAENKQKLDKTVIVLPNPDHVIPLLSEISHLVSDFNISMGYPLRRSSFFSLFEFVFNAQLTKKDGEYYTKDYLKVLRHPFVKNLRVSEDPSITRILIHKIEEVLLGQEKTPLGGSLFISPDDVKDLDELYELSQGVLRKMGADVSRAQLKKIIEELHQLLFLSWEEVSDFHSFALVLENFVDVFVKKSFLNAYPLNLKIASRIFDLKEELKQALFNKEQFPGEEIFKIFLNRVEQEMVAFLGSPLKGLQILGLFETRSLNFENVIVMDTNEGVLPKLQIYEPLIPREVMVSLNLDRLEQEEEVQRYQFMRLITSAKTVHLVYEENRDKEKSRFVEELIWARQQLQKKLEAASPVTAAFEVKVSSKFTDIKKTPETLEFLRNLRYSATSINAYIKCPLQFYYKYVLGLSEKEDLLEEPENRQVGTFVHELLEGAFKPFVGRRPVIDAAFRQRFQKELDRKFDDHFGKSMKSDSFLLKSVLNVRMNRFLENEAEGREARQVAQVMAIEQRFEDRIKTKAGEINFVYKVDRIDRLEDGTVLIVDYKTGANDPMPKAFEQIASMELTRETIKKNVRSFQMPLYFNFFARHYKGEPLNAAFYNLRTMDVDEFFGKKTAGDTEAVNRIFARALDAIMSEILDPKVGFKPDDRDVRLCETCPFFNVCR